ncbi:MAG TPA: triose-phosphate isomerase [Desulfotomaculum sp.]|nr:MAG: triosephosphate isomerase [Peptococcaceae bacterium BRH_c8a]KJS78262.1 MAG: triosephosphate isomerase [Desulfotomaculum sp. BICA1-6]HBX24137.1 triose-phosphate isomerase [Desulfotomaculum sp.]
MRKPIIAGNWKMYKTVAEAVNFVVAFREKTAGLAGVEMVLCPPFTALTAVAEKLSGADIALGAQNCYWETEGAYTGEIAPGMLKEIGCRYVILGHSERRQFFGETDAKVNKKVRAALTGGLVPIVCVGELLDEREAGRTEEVVGRQVDGALAGLQASEVAGLVVAYEPVWAIGTGRTASASDAQAVNGYIRGILRRLFGDDAAEAVRIQYGGSVKPGNTAELMAQPDIDGALVGGASLDADSFAQIVRNSIG